MSHGHVSGPVRDAACACGVTFVAYDPLAHVAVPATDGHDCRQHPSDYGVAMRGKSWSGVLCGTCGDAIEAIIDPGRFFRSAAGAPMGPAGQYARTLESET